MNALHYVYHDLDLACRYYQFVAENVDRRLLNYIYVDSPSIHDFGSKPTGFESISDVAANTPSQSISYADLGAAFVEIAARQETFRGQAVIVSATGKVEEHWLPLVGNMLMGLKSRIIG